MNKQLVRSRVETIVLLCQNLYRDLIMLYNKNTNIDIMTQGKLALPIMTL